MRKFARVLTAVFLVTTALGCRAWGAVTNAPPKASYSNVEELRASVRTAVIDLQAGDVKSERAILSVVVVSPAFVMVPDQAQHAVWFLLAAADEAAGNNPLAHEHARRATEFKTATALDWHLRFRTGMAVEDLADCTISLQKIAATWPKTLEQVSDDNVFKLLDQSKTLKSPSNDEYDLLNALFDAGWRPAMFDVRPDSYWERLVLMELDRANMDRALKVAEAIEQHGVLIGMRVDRRFDALVARDPRHFDPVRGAEVELADARKIVADNPDSLTAINGLGEILLQLGRNEEALKLLDAAVAKALPTDGSRSEYKDANEVNWTLDSRETALSRLERVDEAVEQLRKAARRPEHGQVNVSQAINLGEFLISLGRGSEARAAVAEISNRDVSGYGALAADYIRLCAAVQLGDLRAAKQLINRMSEHADDGFGPYSDALYCMGDLDRLAGLYIKRLEQPETRNKSLVDLQDYSGIRPITPFDKVIDERSTALLKRSDIQVEINKVGRIQSWPFASPGTW